MHKNKSGQQQNKRRLISLHVLNTEKRERQKALSLNECEWRKKNRRFYVVHSCHRSTDSSEMKWCALCTKRLYERKRKWTRNQTLFKCCSFRSIKASNETWMWIFAGLKDIHKKQFILHALLSLSRSLAHTIIISPFPHYLWLVPTLRSQRHLVINLNETQPNK